MPHTCGLVPIVSSALLSFRKWVPCICYIIKEWFFYFNHFSLIIFYHSVWLGFELFGLRDQVHSTGYSLHLRAKDMTIMIVIINNQTGNVAGVWMTSCPGEMGWEFGRFWKNHSSWSPTMVLRSWSPTMELKVDIGSCRQKVGFSAIEADSWDLRLDPEGWVSVMESEKLSYLPLRQTVAVGILRLDHGRR